MPKKCTKATPLEFKPFPLIGSAHAQTMIAAMPTKKRAPASTLHTIPLLDGDQLVYKVSTPDNWNQNDPTVVLVHGFGGSHRSSHLVRMSHKLYEQGYRIVRINIRGCGPGRDLSKKICHAGQSDDILQVLQELKHDFPQSPITMIGFSMGGNLVLKLAGELGVHAQDYIAKIIALCPPVDLHSTAKLLALPENKYYEKYFLTQLRADVRYRQRKFPDLPKLQLPKEISLLEFDNLYTAPFWGFTDNIHYYESCSAYRVVQNIAVPCNILFSEDDPIIDPSKLNDVDLPTNVHIWQTPYGGHLGFLSVISGEHGFRWMDGQILKWI